MWRDAFNEIRLHPGRFVATVMAIAISVGFLAAVSIFVTTEQDSLSRARTLPLSTSDIEVTVDSPESPLQDKLKGVDGVAGVYPLGSQGTLPVTKGEKSAFVTFYAAPPQDFQWAELAEGHYPSKENETALSTAALRELGLKVGDTIKPEGSDVSFKVVGATKDPKSMYGTIGYLASGAERVASSYGIRVDKDADVKTVMANLTRDVPGIAAKEASQVRQENLDSATGEFNLFKGMLQGFGVVALLVGSITIANTFTILLTQRRRQIALLRAVGASTGQVAGRLVIEAFLLGLLGSLAGLLLGTGVAAIGASFTGGIYWGLKFPAVDLVVIVGVGVFATVASAVLPSIRATRVKPIEALQAVPTEVQARRASIVRMVLCVLLIGLGVAVVIASRQMEFPLLWAIGGSVPLSLGILLGAPLYVPPLLKGLATLFGWRPTARLALLNASRNPRRAAATATALMLAVGLIATLQVSIATARTSGLAAINERYPVDLAVQYKQEVTDQNREQVGKINGIERVTSVATKEITVDGMELVVRDGETPEKEVGLKPTNGRDDVIVVPTWVETSSPVRIGGRELRVETSENASMALVSADVFADIDAPSEVKLLWLKMTDRSSVVVLKKVVETTQGVGEVVESGAFMASLLTQVLDVLLMVLTALLGVAVLVALVGVGNTLGLSVLERQRESALLRALGMQRRQLRLTLLIEAMALVGVGAIIGLAAGLFFGWLGASSTLLMMAEGERPDLVFAIDPWWTLGLIGVCLVAACLASVLPGRKAANATPTEALAVE